MEQLFIPNTGYDKFDVAYGVLDSALLRTKDELVEVGVDDNRTEPLEFSHELESEQI